MDPVCAGRELKLDPIKCSCCKEFYCECELGYNIFLVLTTSGKYKRMCYDCRDALGYGVDFSDDEYDQENNGKLSRCR